MNGRLSIAILAAGGATRFGGGKLDAQLWDKPLGRHALETALGLGTPLIVVGEPVPAFAREAEQQGEAELLPNPRAGEGLGTSVALAAAHARETGADRLLLHAADMPLVRSDTLGRLAGAEGIAAVRHADGHPGIPACFPRAFFPALEALDGDRGAGALLRGAQGLVLAETAPGELSDVDTAAELEALAAAIRAGD